MLRSEYLKRGVNFYLGTKVTAVSHEGVTVEKDGKASLIEAGKILVSVGRKANLGQVGLDKLNVELLRIPESRPQFGLGAATRPHEVGVASNRGSACRGECVPGPCTHRPSHHGSWGRPKPVA